MYKPDSCAEVPESQYSIPKFQESKMAIATDHKVVMPMETALGYTIISLIMSQIPDHLIWKRERFV